MIARNRSLAALTAESIIETPLSRCSFATSTMRIAFFDDNPINRTRPICASNFIVQASKILAKQRSRHHQGTADDVIIIGNTQLSY